MTSLAKAALESGVSLIALPEGGGTGNGHVRPFKKGIFNLAQKFGIPVVPVSIVGSYEFFQTGNWMLYPGKITVYLHETIDTAGNSNLRGAEALRQHVQRIVTEPVEEALKSWKPPKA